MENTLKERQLTTESGKKIHIYDDVFTHAEMDNILNYVDSSKYSKNITVTSSHLNETTFFQSNFNPADLDNMRILNSKNFIEILEKHFSGYENISIWSILTTYMTHHIIHTDSFIEGNGDLTLLYYVNPEWNSTYGGETLFANDFGEFEKVVECKPSRVVVFESTIPHKISPMSLKAPPFRYTFVMRFKKVNK